VKSNLFKNYFRTSFTTVLVHVIYRGYKIASMGIVGVRNILGFY